MILISLSRDLRMLKSVCPLEPIKASHHFTPLRHEKVPRPSQSCPTYHHSVHRNSLLLGSKIVCLRSSRRKIRKLAIAAPYVHLLMPPTGLSSSPTPKTKSLTGNSCLHSFESVLPQFLKLCFFTLVIQFCDHHHPPTAEAVWLRSAKIEIAYDSRNIPRDALFISNHAAALADKDVPYKASITDGSDPNVGLVNGRLQACHGSDPCVSTSSFRSPSRFMPPWTVGVHPGLKHTPPCNSVAAFQWLPCFLVNAMASLVLSPNPISNFHSSLKFITVLTSVVGREFGLLSHPPCCVWDANRTIRFLANCFSMRPQLRLTPLAAFCDSQYLGSQSDALKDLRSALARSVRVFLLLPTCSISSLIVLVTYPPSQ